jgi:anti-sigma factor RsiW
MKCDQTVEMLAAYFAGDLPPDAASGIDRHLEGCSACRDVLQRMRRCEAQLRQLGEMPLPEHLASRSARMIADHLLQQRPQEILTLREVGQVLRLTPEQVQQIADTLPSFVVVGEVRVRRDRLMQWIQQQEQHSLRDRVRSQTARIVRAAFEKGMAS